MRAAPGRLHVRSVCVLVYTSIVAWRKNGIIGSIAYWKCTGVSSRGRRFDAHRGGDGGGDPVIVGLVGGGGVLC